MVTLTDLSYLPAFADLGTLSRVAEQFHVSTPSVTRAMQHLEDDFGVPLFTRGKNKIELTPTGQIAAQAARKLLAEAEQTVQQVRDFDQRQRTVVVRACAPAPLWELLPKLNARQPGRMISSAICRSEDVLAAWDDGSCDIAVLPFPVAGAQPFLRENLFVCVPPGHALAQSPSLTFQEINGFNFLLRSELGFWDALCRQQMPASKFLVQTDNDVFDELVNASSLPCFTTDYAHLQSNYRDRVHIPLTDAAAHVTFYLLKK